MSSFSKCSLWCKGVWFYWQTCLNAPPPADTQFTQHTEKNVFLYMSYHAKYMIYPPGVLQAVFAEKWCCWDLKVINFKCKWRSYGCLRLIQHCLHPHPLPPIHPFIGFTLLHHVACAGPVRVGMAHRAWEVHFEKGALFLRREAALIKSSQGASIGRTAVTHCARSVRQGAWILRFALEDRYLFSGGRRGLVSPTQGWFSIFIPRV